MFHAVTELPRGSDMSRQRAGLGSGLSLGLHPTHVHTAYGFAIILPNPIPHGYVVATAGCPVRVLELVG